MLQSKEANDAAYILGIENRRFPGLIGCEDRRRTIKTFSIELKSLASGRFASRRPVQEFAHDDRIAGSLDRLTKEVGIADSKHLT